MPTIVTPHFAAPTNSPPAFAGVRARPGQKFAVEWVKKRLREIHRESPLNEASAHLYLLIATYVLDRRFTSEPILAKELVAIMHCDAATVTRARRRLMDLGELTLVDGGQGKAYVQFELLKMAGPLYAEKGGVTADGGRATSCTESEVTSCTESEVASADVGQLPAQSRKFDVPPAQSRKYGSGSNRSEEEESSSTDQNGSRHYLEALDQVDRFVHWWSVQFPPYNGGVLGTVRDCDRDAAIALLDGRSLERVQGMAIEMWRIETDRYRRDANRCWIAASDRSIRVLLEKSTFIEQLTVRREALAAAEAERQRRIEAIAAEEEARQAATVDIASSGAGATASPGSAATVNQPGVGDVAQADRRLSPLEETTPNQGYVDAAIGWAMVHEALNKTKRAG